jgi:hypothetical protein
MDGYMAESNAIKSYKDSQVDENLALAAAILKNLKSNPDCPASRLLLSKFTLIHPSYRRRSRLLLTENARNALEKAVFGKDAKKVMEQMGLTEEKVKQDFLMRMSLDDIRHFNHMPEGLVLHVGSPQPCDTKLVIAQTKIYHENRAAYIRFLGQNFRDQLHKAGIENADIASMALQGILPSPWTVEHIRPRGTKRSTLYPDHHRRNTFGNLILMPHSVNSWNNDLEQRQFRGRTATRSPLIISARPKYGPENGIIIFGSKIKAQIAPEALRKLLWTQINSLPIAVRLTGPMVALDEPLKTCKPKPQTTRGVYV